MVATRSSMGIPKEGAKPSRPAIAFEVTDLTATFFDKKEKKTVTILDRVSGCCKQGKVVGLLGPSGGGKTTLLSLLAGRLPLGGGARASGSIEPAPSPRQNAFVYQEDALCAYLTPREHLALAAGLKGAIAAGADTDAAVEETLRSVNLVEVADRSVGDGKSGGRRGLSGGERKRVAIAVELLHRPSAIFLDEPTSGLDAHQATKVMEALSGRRPPSAAGEGSGSSSIESSSDDAGPTDRVTCMVSLHQPSAALLQHCDEVLLLGHGGRVLFWGPPLSLAPFLERALSSAAAAGLAAGLEHELLRPALGSDFEFALAAASVDHSSPRAAELSRARLATLQDAWRASNEAAAAAAAAGKPTANGAGTTTTSSSSSSSSSLRRWRWLLWRAWRLAGASPGLVAVRVAANLVTATIFGTIFYQLPPTQVSVAARKGLCQVVCNYAAMTSMVKTLGAFRTESKLVERERASGLYSCAAFYTSKVVAELPLSLFLTALLGCTTHFLTHPSEQVPLSQCTSSGGTAAAAAGLCPSGASPGGQPPPLRWAAFVALLALLWQVGSALGLMLGALMPSVDAALEMGKMLTMVSIIFGGLYFNEATLPAALRWVPRASPVKRAFEGLIANEFREFEFQDYEMLKGGAPSGGFATGREVLADLGLVSPLTSSSSTSSLSAKLGGGRGGGFGSSGGSGGGGDDEGWAVVQHSAVVLLASACVLHLAAFAVLSVVKKPRFVSPAI